MRNRRFVLVFVIIGWFALPVIANQLSLDSLKQVVKTLHGLDKVKALNEISTLLATEDPNAAMAYSEESIQLAKDLNDLNSVAECYNALGHVFQSKYDYANAMKSFVEALKIRDKLEDKAGVAESKNNIGRVFFLQENYTQAEENLVEALAFWEEIKNLKEAAETNKNLGDVFLASNIYGKALGHYQKALDLNIENEDHKGAARIANHMGKISRNLGDYDGALVYFNMSRDLHSAVEDLPAIATDFNNIVLTLIAQDALEEAEEDNQTAFDLRQQLGDEFGQAESLKNFGVIYTKNGNETQAKLFLGKSTSLLKKLNPQPGIPELYKAISETYAGLKEYDKAYENHLAFSSSRDILFDREKSKALLELTTKYESEFAAEKQKRMIEFLEMENATSKKVRFFLFSVLGLIIALLISVYISYKRKQKDNRLLLAKNKEIARQKEEIDKQNITLEENNARLDDLNKKLVDEMAERESIEKSSFARDRFLATMSHEMRTPINIIIGLTHLLLDEDPREDQIEHLRTLQYSANNLVVFINDVLDFSKIEAGKLDLQNRLFKPEKALLEIRDQFEVPAKEKGIQLKFDYDPKIPERLMGDSARLNQIMTNLVTTSYNYTDTGSIEVRMELEELDRTGAKLKLKIKDTGKGLEPEKVEEMFRVYSNSSEDIFEGFGSNNLTLAITKRLVDLQNGKIEVETGREKGTVFTVILPYKISQSKKRIPKPGKSPSSYIHLSGNRILLVEDNKINQLVVAKMLRKLDMEVTTADDGLFALEEFEKNQFDLVLMDIQMPNMDGYRTTAEIRKHADPAKRDIPIIALTASAFLTEKEKAKLFGMNDHVGKPFGPEELLEKIGKCLEIHKKA